MNLYKISQNTNNNWETYDSAVVVANSVEKARQIIPAHWMRGWLPDEDDRDSWVAPEEVHVEFIGVVDADYLDKLNGRTTVVSSYNNG
ncbi:hypothetical protein NBT14_04245 [Weissella paramesenteroides]|uniref:hypothetical protein n=1 Tax=Weissella paramesenteroides TaxID=1249 RepID=UPI003857928C